MADLALAALLVRLRSQPGQATIREEVGHLETQLGLGSVHRLSADTWWDLSRWTKEHVLISGFDRRFIFNVGILANRGKDLSERQASHLAWLLDMLVGKLVDVGYPLFLGLEDDEPLLYRLCPNGHKIPYVRSRFCTTCGTRFPGTDPDDVRDRSKKAALQRRAKASDDRVFHAVCPHCGNHWSWVGAHRSARQKCLQCGRRPTTATLFDGGEPKTLEISQIYGRPRKTP